MTVRIGVVVFPGSNCDIDAVNALEVAGAEPVVLWHEDVDLDGVDAVVLPGGFAYGDYLRAGSSPGSARSCARSPRSPATAGSVLGICNGFQVLDRGGPPARRAAAQPRPALRVAARSRSPPERLDTPFTARDRRAPAAAHAGRPRRGLLLRGRRDARRARGATARSCSATSGRTGRRPAARTTGQPERLAAGDRRRDRTPPATWRA